MGDETNQNRTTALFNSLLKTSNLEQFIDKNAEAMQLRPFSQYITELCRDRGEVPEQVIKRANIERSFGHQVFRGSRNPSRDTVLQLAFGLGADVDTAQELLKHARMSALYPRVKRDAAIIYCLHNQFPLTDAQRVLFEMDLPLMGGSRVR
jgi:transcriptional regulator with XRE-family HTH domain